MQSQNKLFEDFSRLMTNAMGVAQGARDEFETAFRSWFERLLQEYNIVSREELEAVRTMALNARAENEALTARITELEAAVSAKKPRSLAANRKTTDEAQTATEDDDGGDSE